MPSNNIEVKLEGRGSLTLRPNDYITTGGEASIYRVKSIVVKLYTDPDKMIRNRYSDKISLLSSKYQHPFIISPQGLVLDNTNKSIGYYMPYAEGEPFSRVFTNAYRQRENFNDIDSLSVVEGMREIVDFAHQKGALLVDANELNWLMIKNKKAEPRVLDIDSWQIGSKWPATVIMPSIRDYHTHDFNEFSDWFSWGIVSFQLFTGIHPYKGRLEGYKPSETERRMKDNASVFHSGVHLNQNVRDFSCIPNGLLDWYHNIFEDGVRTNPPLSFTTPVLKTPITRVLRKKISATGSLTFEKLFDTGSDPLVQIYPCGLGLRSSGWLVDLKNKRNITISSPHTEIVKASDGWIIIQNVNGKLDFSHINEINYTITKLSLLTNTNRYFRADNRLFLVEDGLCELKLMNVGKPILTRGNKWNILPNATEWFDGLGIQNYLGSKFFVIPFGEKANISIRVSEIDDIQVINAKAGFRFATLVGIDKSGSYKKMEFTFDKEYKSYTFWANDADNSDLNTVILPNGVTASIITDNELIIYVPQSSTVKKINDKNIDTTLQLTKWNDKVVYIKDGNLWQVRTI